MGHHEDERDAMIPLMIWYAVEPLAASHPSEALSVADSSSSCFPLVRQYLVRRVVAADANAGLARVVSKLDKIEDSQIQRDWLLGIIEALRGRKNLPQPEGWPRLFTWLRGSNSEVSDLALRLGLILGDPKAVAVLRETLESPTAPPEARTRALQALVEQRTPGLVPPLHTMLGDQAMRGPALRALAVYPDDATAPAILARYREFDASERADAIQTLATRPADALALLDAVEKGVVPTRDLTATTARQLQAFGDKRIGAKLEKVWGTIRPTAREKAALMARYQADLTPERLKSADLAAGRLVFQRNCAQCHRLNGEGGDVGPELTGSDRANLSYVLENVLDPSATVGRDYRLTTIATADGRLLSGIIREQNDQTLTIQTVNDRLTLDRSEVEEMKPSPQSMMPEGLFEKLTPDEVRDLVAYLAAKGK